MSDEVKLGKSTVAFVRRAILRARSESPGEELTLEDALDCLSIRYDLFGNAENSYQVGVDFMTNQPVFKSCSL